MASPETRDISRILDGLKLGNPEASAELFESVYSQLRNLAAAHFRHGAHATLQPTALVHEAWLKLDGKLEGVKNRGHFLALAGMAMRQILADRARAARTLRRDRGRAQVTVEIAAADSPVEVLDIIALDEALTKLSGLKARHARVVELRFLASLTLSETAEALGVSRGTVEADWSMAQAWLRLELERD